MCDCYIGILNDYEETRMVTLEELKENIKSEKQLAENTDIEWLKELYSKYTLTDYCDKRKSTDLTRFNYCPLCGKKIDWEAIKNNQ